MKLVNAKLPFAPCALTALGLLSLLVPVDALYFYMEPQTPKCFHEDLPKNTLVVGHYTAENYNSNLGTASPAPQLNIQITVDEVFDNDHRVVNQKGSNKGRFTFTAADSGDHRICFAPSEPGAHGGWLSSGVGPHNKIKFSLDLAIGETSTVESSDKKQVDALAQRIRGLNDRLNDIRREQVFQREREAEFRDQSETTNSRVVRWTLIQLAVLGITCAWQLTHLRAFFIKQKLT